MVKKKPVVITIDTREKDEELLGMLTRFGAVLDKQYLPVGDIGIMGRDVSYGFEHKSVSDLGNSMNRIFEQVKALADNADIEGSEYVPGLLLIGNEWELWKKRGFKMQQIAGVMNTIQFDFGLKVLKAHNNYYGAYKLVNLARRIQYEKEKKVHPLRTAAKRKMTEYEKGLYVLEGFPAIGASRARIILNTYGTVDRSLEAMKNKKIAEIDGISTGISSAVAAVFGCGVSISG